MLDQAKAAHPTITKIWVDAGSKTQFTEHAAALGIDDEIVLPQYCCFAVAVREGDVEGE